jgi:hypothetical protein
MNLYAYVGGDPINYIDPDGNFAITGMIIAAAVLVAMNPDIANAPAVDDETYASNGAAGIITDAVAEGALGYAGGKIAGKLLSKCVSKKLALPKSFPKNIHAGQQGKHIPGHNNFTPGRSSLTVDAQKLLNGVHEGTHPIVRMTPRNQPVVNFGKPIGEFGGKATQYGIIHHGKKGAHIVPANPIQF